MGVYFADTGKSSTTAWNHGETCNATVFLPSHPAALKVKMKTTNRFLPESAPNPRSPEENENPDPPPDPPGGVETRTK